MTRRRPADLAKYGLSPADFDDLWRFQQGRCALCRRPFTASRWACIDHSHRTGNVRGLLCPPDNDWLGRRIDDADFYQRVTFYLSAPPATRLPGPRRRHRDAPPLLLVEVLKDLPVEGPPQDNHDGEEGGGEDNA